MKMKNDQHLKQDIIIIIVVVVVVVENLQDMQEVQIS
jgi:hypothetical protein